MKEGGFHCLINIFMSLVHNAMQGDCVLFESSDEGGGGNKERAIGERFATSVQPTEKILCVTSLQREGVREGGRE